MPARTAAAVDLRAWIGRSEESSDVVTPVPAAALAATLDRDEAAWLTGDRLPWLWHWLYFLPLAPQRELGTDGHPRRGGFLPPVPLPRRMWAGGRFDFREPLAIGESVLRTSRILDVSEKSGRSGSLVFVRVQHEISHETSRGSRVAVVEEHDIVYRDAPRADAAAPALAPAAAAAARSADFELVVDPTEVLLFRFSALTFNGHRIHYDRRYCQQDEGYPGLVVHGPLQALLLLELLQRQRPHASLARYAFRAVRPLFDGAPFRVRGALGSAGGDATLWAEDAHGHVTMEATADFA